MKTMAHSKNLTAREARLWHAWLQISEAVTSAVDDWIGDNEQPDDITLVLARAR